MRVDGIKKKLVQYVCWLYVYCIKISLAFVEARSFYIVTASPLKNESSFQLDVLLCSPAL